MNLTKKRKEKLQCEAFFNMKNSCSYIRVSQGWIAYSQSYGSKASTCFACYLFLFFAFFGSGLSKEVLLALVKVERLMG